MRVAVLVVFFLAVPAFAAEPLPYATVERIRTLSLQGWNSAYNFELEKANALFSQASRLEALHPRPHLGRAMISFWRYLLNRRDEDKAEFLALAESTITAAEQFEDTYGEDADVKLCLGTIYGYRTFVYGRAKSYLAAAWDGKKSYDYLSDALKLDPRLHDAYLGIGLFHYFVTFIPKPLQWVVSVMGIPGDNELGLREIRSAAQRGVFVRTEAQYYLAQFLPWHDGEFETSESILAKLHDEFPSNTLITFSLAVWEMRRADMASAGDRLAPLAELTGDDYVGIRSFATYKYAETLFRLNEFRRSREMYQRFLASYKEHVYTATSNYRIGYSFEIAGLRDSALVYYRKAAEREHRFGDDAYSARKAGRLIAHPMAAADTLLCLAQNAQKSGKFDDAVRLYASARSASAGSVDMTALAVFGMGETLFEKKSYREALPRFRELLASSVEKELWLLPWSHYYAGLCLLKTGDGGSAAGELERVLEYDDYDFKNWLEFRTRRELSKLEN